jgi:hypothetical protein
MTDSHYTLDYLSPSSSSSSSSESGVGTVGAKVNQIWVQPHCVSKDKKPILDYNSNNDFYPPDLMIVTLSLVKLSVNKSKIWMIPLFPLNKD